MAKTHFEDGECVSETLLAHHETGSTMNETNRVKQVANALETVLEGFHRDESGVAMTEYILVFTLISFGATVALIATAVYIKAYRDFMVWWFGHPAV
ncbi:MAG: hypothetical protein ACOC9W_03310 [Persicimonas sp.]